MVGWHHRLDGHIFEEALGVGDGQGSLACCSPWGHKESDTTERISLSNQNLSISNINLHLECMLKSFTALALNGWHAQK